MSSISLAPVNAVLTAPAVQNTGSRAGNDRGEAAPSVQTISKAAVAAAKAPAPADTDNADKLRERLKAIASDFGSNTNLVIRQDGQTKNYIYEFRDGTSGELIRQYPEADLAALLKAQHGKGSGVFVKTLA
jgi:uncharacterized FlaG/YvyC family protein